MHQHLPPTGLALAPALETIIMKENLYRLSSTLPPEWADPAYPLHNTLRHLILNT